jgi:hypothetical protein
MTYQTLSVCPKTVGAREAAQRGRAMAQELRDSVQTAEEKTEANRNISREWRWNCA